MSRFCAAVLRLIALDLLIATSAVYAADPPDPLAGVRIERDLAYVPGGDPAQVLDLYLPPTPDGKALPLLVWIHGGAWQAGSKSGGSPATSMATHGYAVASVEYRFSQVARFPAQIQDCQAAIRWLRANAKQYGYDAAKIGVWGSSAGGHLANLVGTTGGEKIFPAIGGNEDQSDQVQAVCDFFGPSDFTTVIDQAAKEPVKNVFKFNTPDDPFSKLTGSPLADDETTRAVSPVHYVTKNDPPFLILHGTHDPLVPFAQSAEFDAALRAAGVSSLLQKIPSAAHGGPEFRQPAVRKLILCFFDKHLKGTDVKIAPLPASAFGWQPTTKPN